MWYKRTAQHHNGQQPGDGRLVVVCCEVVSLQAQSEGSIFSITGSLTYPQQASHNVYTTMPKDLVPKANPLLQTCTEFTVELYHGLRDRNMTNNQTSVITSSAGASKSNQIHRHPKLTKDSQKVGGTKTISLLQRETVPLRNQQSRSAYSRYSFLLNSSMISPTPHNSISSFIGLLRASLSSQPVLKSPRDSIEP